MSQCDLNSISSLIILPSIALSTESFVCRLVHYISIISPTSNLETSLLQIQCYDLAKPFMLHNICTMKYLVLPMELKFSPPLLLLYLYLLRCFFSLPLFLSLCLCLSIFLNFYFSPSPSLSFYFSFFILSC